MRKPLVAGNWKMNTDGASGETLARAVVAAAATCPSVDVVVFPPFPYLMKIKAALGGSAVALGGQDVYFEPKGAFTGEVSVGMLADCGCTWALVGHSERRHLIQETDDLVRRKMVAALSGGLQPILCVGETLAQRQLHQTEGIIEAQLLSALNGLSTDQLSKLVIAYEPVWAIGTGQTATPEQAQQVHHYIRQWIERYSGANAATSIRLLYGGSVTAANAASLMQQPDVDGLLVGGASLKTDDFTTIMTSARR